MAERPDRIQRALDRSYHSASRIQTDPDSLRWIIFSDHHRGTRDGADDFAPCEKNYLKALRHYEKEGYSLCLLGDVEEFWENTPLHVMAKYRNVLQAEKSFFDKGRLHRIWGNHDDDWRVAGQISRHLGWLFPKINVHEGIVLELSRGAKCLEILLVHGHQGTLNSDRLAWISRLFVRFIWRNIQRLFRVPLSTPANNIKLKSAHDQAMYNWADRQDKVIICGHTHHPVFMSFTHADRIRQELTFLQSQQQTTPSEETAATIAELEKKLLQIQLDEGESLDVEHPKPFYFNSGCCSYGDGDITGLELADGQIRLIKWSAKTKERMVLGTTELKYLLDYC
ncbi:MAG: metallophosphoesterase [Flavobacteriales bacterium]|nr:metallophosphoesterase [Flavobacteriales bacterium]